MRTLTHWARPNEIIHSGYGSITYAEWCQREANRISRNGRHVAVVRQPRTGKIALARAS